MDALNNLVTLQPPQVAGSPTQALLRTPVLRLTAMLRMLKIFPEDLFGDDDFFVTVSHVSYELLLSNNEIVQPVIEFRQKLTG